MATEILEPRQANRSIIELFLNEIEKLRHLRPNVNYNQDIQYSLSLLENIILLIERRSQDLHKIPEQASAKLIKSIFNSRYSKSSQLIVNTLDDFLSEWLSWLQNTKFISDYSVDIVTYNLIPVVNLLSKRINHKVINSEELAYDEAISIVKIITKLEPKNYYPDCERNSTMLYRVNFFGINNFEDYKYKDIEELLNIIENFNFKGKIERLFEFDEKKEDAIWEINIKIDDEKFNAAEIGYLMWTFSKGLESIDDIEVELTDWGNGSKYFNLKVRIKSLAAKVDLMEVLKEIHITFESFYFNKPLTELNKIEAETDKLKREIALLPNNEEIELKKQIEYSKSILDLQKQQAETEKIRAETRLKEVEILKGISDLMKDGVIKNNSNLQIMVNNLLWIKKSGTSVSSIGTIDTIEAKEGINKKPDLPTINPSVYDA